MAQKFSTSGAQTAGVLLRTIPEAQQTVIARELTTKLRSSFDEAAASVAVELVAGREDAALKNDLIDVLVSRIEQGSPDNVASLLSQSIGLSERLVTVAVEVLTNTDKTSSSTIKSGSQDVDKDDQDDDEGAKDSKAASKSTVLYWLRFAKQVVPAARNGDHEQALFRNALGLLHHTDRATALAARDLVFSLFSSSTTAQKNLNAVRETIRALIDSSDSKLQQTLGYALWMRLLAVSDQLDVSEIDLNDDAYWQPLIVGLRNGDGERRKMCLDILKRSVALAVDQGNLGAVAGKDNVSPNVVSYQYGRYCTVFETLVLARYANLVVECQRDLNLLVSADSVIQSRWLWTLLGTALDAKTQDQNRRFIGDWILRSELFSSRFTDGLAEFMSQSFLPWVMEGHLFVSSTKIYGESLSCRHGDRLATFIRNVIKGGSDDLRPQLLDAMFAYLMRKHATIFAYSAVHLIRGISQAFEAVETLSLSEVQLESLLFISGLRTLPEIATEVLIVHCWRIYELANGRSRTLTDGLSSSSQTRLQNLRSAAEFVVQSHSTTQNVEAASPVYSQRDIKIAEAVKKCNEALRQLSSQSTRPSDELQNTLEDIWSDLEYLEYPRELLIKLPLVFFNSCVMRSVMEEEAGNESGLRDLLAATVPRLLDLAQRRSFLLAPLLGQIREILLSTPRVASILDLDASLLRLAQNPPEPSIDLNMEYSAIPLLAGYLQTSSESCKEKYFGKGEGYGFAAYLDLISRCGSQHPELLQSLLETIIARWRRQKNPPPTMSAWKTTLQLEVVLLCFEQLAATTEKAVLDPLINDFWFILSLEPLPRFRYLMEWTIVRIQIRHPDLRSKTLEMLGTKDHQSNPKFIASLMKMGVMLATAECGTEDFAQNLATTFIALSSSSKIVIRHEAQWAFPQLMDHARANGWRKVVDNPAYVSLDDYIRSLPRFGDPPAERIMGKIDPVSDHTMTNLVEGLWTDLDYTRPPYTTRQAFVDLYNDDAKLDTTTWPASCMALGPPIPKPPRAEPEPAAEPSLLGPKQMTQDEAIALQTKGTAYLKTSLDDSSAKSSKHELLLVASLIENPYNLGGLSRVSEIFGAQAMYVRDPRIIAEKDFTSVSVSSHNHVDIMPLTVPDMSGWMTQKKSEGWTVVGIEQTDRSVLLGEASAVLPEKTILVLGSESLGMPAAVLGECDMLVEIPQIGVTRSLNVQTAAAIVLFEYGRQHRK